VILQSNLAEILLIAHRLDEAVTLLNRALAVAESKLPADHPDLAVLINNMALTLKKCNRLGDAEALYKRSLATMESIFGPEHPAVAVRLNNLARLLIDTHALQEAEPYLRRAVQILLKCAAAADRMPTELPFALRSYMDLCVQTQLSKSTMLVRLLSLGELAGVSANRMRKIIEEALALENQAGE
jgi:tetratricopeptide (TPR) repeat protein